MRDTFSTSEGRCGDTLPRPDGSHKRYNPRWLQHPRNSIDQRNTRYDCEQRDHGAKPMSTPVCRTNRLSSIPNRARERNSLPDFLVQLLHPPGSIRRAIVAQDEIESLVSLCDISPETPPVCHLGTVCATISFRRWADALAALLSLWKSRLHGVHDFVPKLIPHVTVPSTMEELHESLRTLFSEHILSLIGGGKISKWEESIVRNSNEIDRNRDSMKRKGLSLPVFCELKNKDEGLRAERDLIKKRVTEFKTGLGYILRCLESREKIDDWEKAAQESSEVVNAFTFDTNGDWYRIHQIVRRECRRLDDGLPIYGCRMDILRRIHSEQVLVLIGETGSGKSTQLVQFLADSGVAANGSIVCTQPRKIAAISLNRRVEEEADGCYANASVCCFESFFSGKQLKTKLIYTTDNGLLRYCLRDKNLSGISCIIVDEAHERSLNTDLLLAMLKDLLCVRVDLRLVIMSATANANQLSEYFFGCTIYHVSGRAFPVEITYTPPESACLSSNIYGFVQDVVQLALKIHRTENDGSILAFLTSQAEVEWACERFESPSAIALPLHGKLSFEEQCRVFQNYPGKRKVIFSTNIAETSLTITGVRYVIDSGMAKESKMEPGSGMSVLKLGWISQSSANQRAGRAGRTGPGKCYRLYSENDFRSMPLNQEPEIRRVHLGIAVLKILSLGVKSIENFDFVDAPSPEAISLASRNLAQLGAITQKNGVLELTDDGRYFVKLGVEPRLGKLILCCFRHYMGKEGLVLAAVMANAGSIFCRVGSYENKRKADCLKVKFCNQNGDLFTLLSVYREWEALPKQRRKSWCWENSVNAKSLQRCDDTIKELEICLEKELGVIAPSYWLWNPENDPCEYNKRLKEVILTSLQENVAMYTGCDQLGYQVAVTGQNLQLHPSCSLLVFDQKPSWVVFSEILSATNQYLVCVTAIDFELLSTLDPPVFDFLEMERLRLQVKVMDGLGSILLRKFCGKSNARKNSLIALARSTCADARIRIEVFVGQNKVMIYAPAECMKTVSGLVIEVLAFEKKFLENECLEKCLYQGPSVTPVALFGAGAQIKHLELEKRFLTLNVHLSNERLIDDKDLISFIEEKTDGIICSVYKSYKQDNETNRKWGRVTFLNPDSASNAGDLQGIELDGTLVRLIPARTTFGGDHRQTAVRAKIFWPRRRTRGKVFVRCEPSDISTIVQEISSHNLQCELSKTRADTVVVNGLDKELLEREVLGVLKAVTSKEILDIYLPREAAVDPSGSSEELLLKELSKIVSSGIADITWYKVQVFPPEPKDYFMKALITFDGSMHLEAAKALQELEGRVLPGCLPWQRIKCQQLFSSSLSCSPPVYNVIKRQLDSLLQNLNARKDVECVLEQMDNGCYRVKISATATKTIADVRRHLEQLMMGRTIKDRRLTPNILQHLFSREGNDLMWKIKKGTKTHMLFDRQNLEVRAFGSPEDISMAERELIESLLKCHENKQLEIHLRCPGLPMNIMKEIVKQFGPDLQRLKEKIPGIDLYLDARRQIISVHGDLEMKKTAERLIYELSLENRLSAMKLDNEPACPICLCDIEEPYQLGGCLHSFCRMCLIEQLESATRNLDIFPIRCAYEGCNAPILIVDLKLLLPPEKLEQLFRASLTFFVSSSRGTYNFCPSPDCPSVYRVADPGSPGKPFHCGACYVETCTQCRLEYHPYISCEVYRKLKEDPDLSLKVWSHGKEHVKTCPACGCTIEKVDGCDHMECKCGRHVCWICLEDFTYGYDCIEHLRNLHIDNNL